MADPDMTKRERWRHFDRGRTDRDHDYARLRFDLWLAERQRKISSVARKIEQLAVAEKAGVNRDMLHAQSCRYIVEVLSDAHEATINDKLPRPDPKIVAEKLGPLGESGYRSKGGGDGE